MTPLVLVLATAVPLLAGWAVHAAVLRRQLGTARRDPVTGLPARAAWTRQARKMTRRRRGAVLLLDLDKFKEVNDTCGHDAGDAVLKAAALRVRSWSDQAGGVPGRLGGDELVIVTRAVPASAALDALTRMLATPVDLPGGRTVAIAASVGVAACPRNGLPGALKAADTAMYQVKRSRCPGGGWRYAGTIPGPRPVRAADRSAPDEGAHQRKRSTRSTGRP